MKATVGIIGISVMGAALARNCVSKKYRTAIFNRSREKTEALVTNYPSELWVQKGTIPELVQSLEKPRKIILMIQAGPAVDEVLFELASTLEPDDIVIDGGNSLYTDTIRRSQELAKKKIQFIGCGISGGEQGALHGPSMMVGGSAEAWQEIRNFLEPLAAKDFHGSPCVNHVGPDGAGHFVKMVHNGIEYGMLQLIAESYEFLKKISGANPGQVAEFFESSLKGPLNSYLIEIAGTVLQKKDDLTEKFLIESILDITEQKGTGNWTVQDALLRGVAVPVVAEAVFSRMISAEKKVRSELRKQYPSEIKPSQQALQKLLQSSLLCGFILLFAQGFHLIRKASDEQNWDIQMSEIARIWQGGCIVRSILLMDFEEFFKNFPVGFPLQSPAMENYLKTSLQDLRHLASLGIEHGIALPGFLSCLSYFHQLRTDPSSASLIALMRDFFGSHGYRRTDREGTFHTLWS